MVQLRRFPRDFQVSRSPWNGDPFQQRQRKFIPNMASTFSRRSDRSSRIGYDGGRYFINPALHLFNFVGRRWGKHSLMHWPLQKTTAQGVDERIVKVERIENSIHTE